MLKVLQKNQQKIVFNIVFIIIIAFFWWSTDIGDIKEYYVDRSISANNFTFYVYGESQVFQKILCNTDGINELEIPIDTQKDRYRGEFKVTLADEDSNIIQEWNTDKGVLYADKWIEYKLDEPLKKGETYNLIISATGLDLANAIEVTGIATLNTANKNLNVSYLQCYYNGESDGCVAFAAVKRHLNYFAVIAIIIVLIVLNIYLYYGGKGADITKYSFTSIFLLGLIMLIIFSPASGADEDFHYNTSLALSNVLMGRDNISEVEQEYVFDYIKHVNDNDNFVRLYKGMVENQPIDDTKSVIGAKDRIGNLNYPSGYIIPAIGISLGRMLRLNGVQVYTIARLFNLLFYAILVQIAIMLIPIKKELVYIIAINPMTLHQASQLSYDNITNGLCIVLFAYILNIIYSDCKIKWRNIGIVLLLILLFGPIKYVYSVYALLLLVVPMDRFANKYDRALKTIVLAAGILVFVILTNKAYVMSFKPIHADLSYVEEYNSINDENVSAQAIVTVEKNYVANEIIKNPNNSSKILVNTINNNIWSYVEGTFGIVLGGASVNIYEYIIVLYMFCVIVVIFSNNTDRIYAIIERSRVKLIAFSCMGCTLIMMAGFLMTAYGSTSIQGIQGRYFIPFIMPLSYGLISKRIRISMNSIYILKIIIYIYIGIIFSVVSQITY